MNMSPTGPNRELVMTVYVLEIKGRGVAAFYASSHSAAEARICDRFFRDDLMVLTTDGLALWDGVTKLQLRQALPGEESKWHASRDTAIRQGNIDGDDEAWIAFLVGLSDPNRGRRSRRRPARSCR
jgi:hypothetical protein